MQSSEILNTLVLERRNFDDRWNNLFAYSVAHAAKFARYLDIILERYTNVSAEYTAQTREHLKASEAGDYSGLERHLESAYALQVRVHLEIESFYLIAKILLDRLALHVEYIFGEARGLSLGSHHKLIDDLTKYAADRGMSEVPAELLAKARELRTKISDYRDDEIAHARNPRVIRGTSFSGDGITSITGGMLYPKEGERIDHSSLAPAQLADLLDGYVADLTAYLRLNLPRAKGYRPAEPAALNSLT